MRKLIPYVNVLAYYFDEQANKIVSTDNFLSLCENALIFSNSQKINAESVDDCIDIIKLYNLNRPSIYKNDASFTHKLDSVQKRVEAYKKSFEVLNIQTNKLKLEDCIPDRLLNEFLDSRLQFLIHFNNNIESSKFEYYNKYFKKYKYALSMLDPTIISREKLGYSMLLNQSVKASIKKLSIPKDRKDIENKIEYDMFGTKTGRLTVSSGINILTLNKNHRSMFKSKWKNGVVILFDFSGMEIKTAFCLLDMKEMASIQDLHTKFAKHIFDNDSNDCRSVTKQIVLQLFYGSSIEKIANSTGLSLSEVSYAEKKIKEIFPYENLSDKYKKYSENGLHIKNYFGRPIFIEESDQDYKLINNYTQSSASDVSLQALYAMLQYKQANKLKSGSIFTIHDAIAVDFHPEEFEKHVDGFKEAMEIGNDFGIRFNVTKTTL